MRSTSKSERAILACLAILLCGLTVDGQEQRKQEFVPVPRDIVMTLVAVQPDCPLQFERVERLMNVEGGGANIYRLLNRSSKPIRKFTISYLFPNGMGGSWSKGANGLIMPGEFVEDNIDKQTQQLLPLNDALKEKLDLRGPMKGFVIYFVESVEFADGSSFKDEATHKALSLYLEDLGDKVHRANRQSP